MSIGQLHYRLDVISGLHRESKHYWTAIELLEYLENAMQPQRAPLSCDKQLQWFKQAKTVLVKIIKGE